MPNRRHLHGYRQSVAVNNRFDMVMSRFCCVQKRDITNTSQTAWNNTAPVVSNNYQFNGLESLIVTEISRPLGAV